MDLNGWPRYQGSCLPLGPRLLGLRDEIFDFDFIPCLLPVDQDDLFLSRASRRDGREYPTT